MNDQVTPSNQQQMGDQDMQQQENVHTESTGENFASMKDAFETPKRKAEEGLKTFDFLGQISSGAANKEQKPGVSKAEYMKQLREKRLLKFEQKRQQAEVIVRNQERKGSYTACEKSHRGSLGHPFKTFNELSLALSKLESFEPNKT